MKVLTAVPRGNIRVWMSKVIRNKFFDLKRKQKREEEYEDGMTEAWTEDVLQLYTQSKERR